MIRLLIAFLVGRWTAGYGYDFVDGGLITPEDVPGLPNMPDATVMTPRAKAAITEMTEKMSPDARAQFGGLIAQMNPAQVRDMLSSYLDAPADGKQNIIDGLVSRIQSGMGASVRAPWQIGYRR
jgi:hypothetical protein